MYTITGVTGHVGGATARALLAHGAPVRAVVRSAAKGEPWAALGAEIAVADFDEPTALTEAFRGSAGAFVMLPTMATAEDAEHRRMAETIAAAVAGSGVPHVVALSSLGAERPEGTGPIRWLHHLENQLRGSGAAITALRACHFQEKVETVLGAVLGAGVYPVFGDTATQPAPMISTHDIGEIAAQSLLAPPSGSEIIDLEGPHHSEQEVATALARQLGRPVQVVTIPRDGWVGSMVEAGLPEQLARELAGLYEAEQRGLLEYRSARRLTGRTTLEQTLQRVLEAVPVP